MLQRLKPFNCKELLYYDYTPLPEGPASEVGARRVEDLKDLVSQSDVVCVNCPLHEGTKGLVNADLLKHFKKGAWLVNTARGAICDKDAVAAALKSGQLNGYSGLLFYSDERVGHSFMIFKGTSGCLSLHRLSTNGAP